MSRQVILLNSANKSNIDELNNNITLRFPNTIFNKSIEKIELLNFNIEYDISIFGDTNNAFYLEYTNTLGQLKRHQVVVEFDKDIILNSDLANKIKTALNNVTLDNYTGTFDCRATTIENIVTNPEVEKEDYTAIFTITSTNKFTFDFKHKDSIGPLIGLGNGEYKNTYAIEGTSTQSIESYTSITSNNESGNNTTLFPNYSDLNCKMELYDQNNNLLQNKANPGNDISISINHTVNSKTYSTIGGLLTDLQTAMNAFSADFSPAANFEITYNYTTDKVLIKNKSGGKFGIGFSFYKNSNKITSGSLHKVLGFRQQTYLGITEIESVKPSISFDRTFAEDYILFCSDLVNNNSDINSIGIGNGDNIKFNNIMFAIPINSSSKFFPNDTKNYNIDISSSKFSIGYRNKEYNDNNPNNVNIYLRLLSGRHIKITTAWSASFALNFK